MMNFLRRKDPCLDRIIEFCFVLLMVIQVEAVCRSYRRFIVMLQENVGREDIKLLLCRLKTFINVHAYGHKICTHKEKRIGKNFCYLRQRVKLCPSI
jgi:hypothetical protein